LTLTTTTPELAWIVDAIRTRQRFVLSSHARPDGDAIGSQLAMAYALRALGKEVRIVNSDPAPPPLMAFPGVADIEIARDAGGGFDAAIIMECGDLARTGVGGLDRAFVINIDHHPGNTGYGNIKWFDPAAAACGEMVFDLIAALGVPLTVEIATHVYVAILTDTGSFHFSSISPRTFEICRLALEAGVDPVQTARNVFDSGTMARLKLFGAVLNAMRFDATGRIAVMYLDQEMARAVIFFKHVEGDEYRVSMRSKGAVDIGAVAKAFGGGGHKNAAGCTAIGPIDALKELFVEKVSGTAGWTGS
jgi:phosphoesterase RecJ-like protein